MLTFAIRMRLNVKSDGMKLINYERDNSSAKDGLLSLELGLMARALRIRFIAAAAATSVARTWARPHVS